MTSKENVQWRKNVRTMHHPPPPAGHIVPGDGNFSPEHSFDVGCDPTTNRVGRSNFNDLEDFTNKVARAAEKGVKGLYRTSSLSIRYTNKSAVSNLIS